MIPKLHSYAHSSGIPKHITFHEQNLKRERGGELTTQ